MSCYNCRRTLKGFIWNLYGNFMIKITFFCGIRWYLNSDCKSKIAGWLVSQYGYARNQYWPSKSEIRSCNCNKGVS